MTEKADISTTGPLALKQCTQIKHYKPEAQTSSFDFRMNCPFNVANATASY